METYLAQLLSDLDAATLAQWRRCPPHFYQSGMRDPMLQPPEGYIEQPPTPEMPGDFEASIGEMEDWMEGKPEVTMFDHFGLTPEEFPAAEKFTEEQARTLVDALVRLWIAYNFMPTVPEKAPARVFYPVMLVRMAKPAMLMKHGVTGIEFCNYYPENCPFGEEHCDCKDF